CHVEIEGECANHPSFSKFNGPDNWGNLYTGSGTSASACAQRASDYYAWCGKSAAVRTTFGLTGAETDVGGCKLHIEGLCMNHPDLTGYNDLDYGGMKYLGAGEDPGVCSNRASAIYAWCGNSAYVTTTYMATGAVSNVGCAVRIFGPCANYPSYTNFDGPDT